MKTPWLLIIFVLLLIYPLSAQEKTYDPGPVQLSVGSSGYRLYGPEGYGSEAEGHRPAESLNYPRYGPEGYGSEAEGHWEISAPASTS